MTTPSPNPFEVLQLPPTASNEEVVRQAGRLRQRATDESTVAALRQAVQALTGRPEERRLHELLTHPQPCHHSPQLNRFAAAFRRVPPAASSAEPTELDFAEIAALLCPLPTEEPATPVAPEEVRRRAVQTLWQCLPFDTGA